MFSSFTQQPKPNIFALIPPNHPPPRPNKRVGAIAIFPFHIASDQKHWLGEEKSHPKFNKRATLKKKIHTVTHSILQGSEDCYSQPQDMEVTLDELRKKMADFAQERDWDQFHSPRNLLLALVGEVGELSEIFQWKGEVPRGLPDWGNEEKQHLGEELSDVLLYLVRLSDICGIDLGEAVNRKLELNAQKYPVNLCKGSYKKYEQIHTKSRTSSTATKNSSTTSGNISNDNANGESEFNDGV